MTEPFPAPAPIIVTALFAPADHAWFDRQRREHFPPERNQLAAHLTMFHHILPSLAGELRQRLSAATRSVAAPRARVVGIISLGGGTAYRIDAPELERVRASLAEAFSGTLTPQDRAGWRPHVTIQNKVAPAAARALRAGLEQEFAPRPVAIAGLASWWYRGGPWEPLGQHMFA